MGGELLRCRRRRAWVFLAQSCQMHRTHSLPQQAARDNCQMMEGCPTFLVCPRAFSAEYLGSPSQWGAIQVGQPSSVTASGMTWRPVTPEAVTYENDFAPIVRQTLCNHRACIKGVHSLQ